MTSLTDSIDTDDEGGISSGTKPCTFFNPNIQGLCRDDPSVHYSVREHELKSGNTSVLDASLVCVWGGAQGVDGDWMPVHLSATIL